MRFPNNPTWPTSCWAEQIDCQHESCLADEIYRCMNFGDCRLNGVCHRAPYIRFKSAFDEIDLCGLLMVIAMNLNSQYFSS